jgi:hypothetical protein
VQRRPRDVEEVDRRRQRAAQLVDAAVVGHAVQPGAQRHRAVVLAQGAVGAQEHVLQGVLGVGPRARQHLARVGEQPLAVAVVDDAERVVVAHPEQRDQLVVAAQAQERTGGRNPAQALREMEG